MATETPEAPSKHVLEEIAEIQEKKALVGRQKAAYEKREKQLLAELKPWVEAQLKANPRMTILRRLSHWINLGFKAKNPSWKDEFIKVAGAERAAEIVREAAKTQTITIKVEPIADAGDEVSLRTA